jgi:transglutaminase-like putative cysteine protease
MRNYLVFAVIGIGFLMAMSPTAGLTGPSYQVPIGPRPIGMSGAFTSVADDISAIYWNPAGLALVGHQEIMGTYANLYGTDIRDNYFAFLLPLSERQAVAIDWYHSGFDDGELGFGQNRFDLSYSLRPHSRVALGLNVKYVTQDINLDGSNVRHSTGRGVDLGVLTFPLKGLKLGLIGQDIFDTKLKDDKAGSGAVFPRTIRAGVSYDIRRFATVAFDVDDRYHLGTEIRPYEGISLRAGLEKDRSGSEDPCYSVGAGFEFSIFRFDYAYVMHPVLDATSHMGLSLAFNFNPSRIRIEKVEVDDIYASLHKTYSEEPIGQVRIRNLQDRPLTAKVTAFLPALMESPTEQEVLLRPKATQEFPLRAVFSDKIMSLADDGRMQIQIAATYQSERLPRTEKKSSQCVVYRAGAIDWGRGVEQAAAFVTPQDPAVDALAREAARLASLTGQAEFANRNLRFAAATFDALAALGVAYVPDPHNPYSAMSETENAVDTVHYPQETLKKLTGDCDDTTVLMAALLANVGIPAKIVDVPGHLFLLADTGLHERNKLALGLDPALYVIDADGVWIPIETTAIDKGFAQAWRIGADEYRGWEARGQINLVDVARAQRRYRPTEAAGVSALPTLPDDAAFQALLVADAQMITSWKDGYMTEHYAGVSTSQPAGPSALNEIAHVYFLAGRVEQARAKLDEILKQDQASAAAQNNMGNICSVSGDMAGAIEHYRAALDAEPDDPGISLNLGLVLYAYGDTANAAGPLRDGVELSGGYDAACRLLGLQGEAPERAVEQIAEKTLSAEEVRLLLGSVLKQIPHPAAEEDTMAAAPEKPAVRPRPADVRIAASRGEARMILEDYLYWKE